MTRSRLRLSTCLWVVALALGIGLAGPATAMTGPAGGTATWNVGWQSSNWAGYVVDDEPYTSVSGQWTVPSVSTSKSGFSAAWLGIDGATNSHLIQVGTEQDSLFGQTSYWAWWEILPAPAVRITSLRIHPGDRITASIRKVSSRQWRITISSAGHGTFITTRTYSGKGTSAEWIVEAPLVQGQQAVLARHAPVIFDHVTANGHNPKLTPEQGGTLIQFHRQVTLVSAPDAQRDGFTVRRR